MPWSAAILALSMMPKCPFTWRATSAISGSDTWEPHEYCMLRLVRSHSG